MGQESCFLTPLVSLIFVSARSKQTKVTAVTDESRADSLIRHRCFSVSECVISLDCMSQERSEWINDVLLVCFLSSDFIFSSLILCLVLYLIISFAPSHFCLMSLFPSPVGPDYKCDETEFSCKTNYRCIPQWARCDGTNDCLDNSDEQGCGQCVRVSADEMSCECIAVMKTATAGKNQAQGTNLSIGCTEDSTSII